MIVAGIVCLVVGYLFGNIQTSYIYGRAHGIDIREHGSGNAGTTNALRVLGKKAGLVVFLGDLFKAIIVTVGVRLILSGIYPEEIYLFIACAGLGVVLGHNFPFYLHFKGGKGIAATAGIVVGFADPVIIAACLIIFIIAVAITRYVSLGSILMVITFATLYTVFALNGKYGFNMQDSVSKEAMAGSIIIVIAMALMAIYRHKANIIRLIHHEENKLGVHRD
jgi:glycerol-3-phosphate acyltransferase PlsY